MGNCRSFFGHDIAAKRRDRDSTEIEYKVSKPLDKMLLIIISSSLLNAAVEQNNMY